MWNAKPESLFQKMPVFFIEEIGISLNFDWNRNPFALYKQGFTLQFLYPPVHLEQYTPNWSL